MKEIVLTHGQVALVDDEDYEWLMQWKWYANKSNGKWYAITYTKVGGDKETGECVKMHRMILNAPKGVLVDHKNGDGLDNRRHNIRTCTYSNNAMNKRASKSNKTGYKGVFWNKQHQKYCAQIYINGKSKRFAYSDSPEVSALAYDKMAKKIFGEFAKLNFPESY